MRYALLSLVVLISGCDAVRTTSDQLFRRSQPQPEAAPEEVVTEPEAQPASAEAEGWPGARTTIAALGDPTTPGRWLRTPLVDSEINGRIVVTATGAQAYVTLVPVEGPVGAGSQLSLDAMRALLLPLDELVELEVYSN